MASDEKRRVAVVQHTSAENLGHLEDQLESRRIGFDYFRPFVAGGRLPSAPRIGDTLVLLGGGPWGSAGPSNLPTLVEELELTYDCLSRGVAVLGMGLGAQILALAAGGRTRAAPMEFRVVDAFRHDPKGLGGFLPAQWPLALYGRDKFELPLSARILAVDAEGAPLVYQVGACAFGFAGNIGFKRAMAEDLLMEFEETPPLPLDGLAALGHAAGGMQSALGPLVTGLVATLGLM